MGAARKQQQVRWEVLPPNHTPPFFVPPLFFCYVSSRKTSQFLESKAYPSITSVVTVLFFKPALPLMHCATDRPRSHLNPKRILMQPATSQPRPGMISPCCSTSLFALCMENEITKKERKKGTVYLFKSFKVAWKPSQGVWRLRHLSLNGCRVPRWPGVIAVDIVFLP